MIVQEADWLLEVRTYMNDQSKFLYFFMCFLSNYGRSGNLFVGSAISITHFAQFCAQRAWRGISAVDHSVDSEHWGYVHSTIPNALVDNILDRLLVYLHGVLNLIIPSDAPYGRSSKFAVETIIQNIKVSQTLIF